MLIFCCFNKLPALYIIPIAYRFNYTPQAPPNPIFTRPSSTITGTFLTPPESFNISSIFSASAFTSKYSTRSP